jgi:hypothetical protein
LETQVGQCRTHLVQLKGLDDRAHEFHVTILSVAAGVIASDHAAPAVLPTVNDQEPCQPP